MGLPLALIMFLGGALVGAIVSMLQYSTVMMGLVHHRRVRVVRNL